MILSLVTFLQQAPGELSAEKKLQQMLYHSQRQKILF